ncbi:YheC/YheD family protein [Paenibacillus albiflavus]|uniref:YheC/YheD family protein n=1 Tax=Paenibacillus albiflavus TaxID=2545760 RepID=A0A4R4E6I9_9BACL|nr:YheC/YheD family protein [Paenibacillus albiflavus]TCZ75324.1 YheC/YheD family protein [Paenibacillus albiflavus]
MSLQTLGVIAVYINNNKIEELDFFRKLSVYSGKEGLQIALFTPQDVDDHKSEIRALFYDKTLKKWVRKRTPIPTLIYDRCRYHGKATYQMLSKFRRTHPNLNYIAKPLANKWSIHNVLSGHARIASSIPETHPYSSALLEKMLKKYRSIYLKPRNGTGGRGIIRVSYLEDGTYQIQGRYKNRQIFNAERVQLKQLPSKLRKHYVNDQYIMQQGIASLLVNGRVCDFRLLIQKNGEGKWDVTGCAGRIGPTRSITSNLHGGGKAITIGSLLQQKFTKSQMSTIKENMYDLSTIIANALEDHYGSLCELGIDLAVDPHGDVWLLEVNPKPSREVFKRIGEQNTYLTAITRPLEYASWLLKKEQER